MPSAAQNRDLLPAFNDPVAESQAVFSVVMRALSRPGRPVALATPLTAPAPLSAEMAAMLLTLADHETTVWLDAKLRAAPSVASFLTFHTGTRIVEDLQRATFVVLSDPQEFPPITDLPSGTPEYPDRSATLLLQVPGFLPHGLELEGPGIDGRCKFGLERMPERLTKLLVQNRATYPCGVDVILTGPSAVVGLPRTVRIAKGD